MGPEAVPGTCPQLPRSGAKKGPDRWRMVGAVSARTGSRWDGPMSPARPTHWHHQPSVRSLTNSSKRAYNLRYTDSCPDPT
jgi:hypothetical protein